MSEIPDRVFVSPVTVAWVGGRWKVLNLVVVLALVIGCGNMRWVQNIPVARFLFLCLGQVNIPFSCLGVSLKMVEGIIL